MVRPRSAFARKSAGSKLFSFESDIRVSLWREPRKRIVVCRFHHVPTDTPCDMPELIVHLSGDYYINVTVRTHPGLLFLNQRCGRSDATKRPFLAAPHPRAFLRKQNDNGTYDSTCPVCNRALGSVRIELTLDELERSHLCLQADLVRRPSEPEPLRAMWDGLPGASIRSVGRSVCALEETSQNLST
jgi:hypothetical protein